MTSLRDRAYQIIIPEIEATQAAKNIQIRVRVEREKQIKHDIEDMINNILTVTFGPFDNRFKLLSDLTDTSRWDPHSKYPSNYGNGYLVTDGDIYLIVYVGRDTTAASSTVYVARKDPGFDSVAGPCGWQPYGARVTSLRDLGYRVMTEEQV